MGGAVSTEWRIQSVRSSAYATVDGYGTGGFA
jgi:hypothetical protein